MKNVIVVQHCQSEHHVNGMTGGWTDTPLTEIGRQQARLVAARLQEHAGIAGFTLYSSDLLRAYMTAEAIGWTLKKRVTVSTALREMNLGSATGMTRKWFEENRVPFPPRGKLDHRLLPDAETIREHFRRVTGYLDTSLHGAVESAIIVTHGGAVLHILCWWLGIPIECQDAFYADGRPGGVSVLARDPENGLPILACFSDMSHLAALNQWKHATP